MALLRGDRRDAWHRFRRGVADRRRLTHRRSSARLLWLSGSGRRRRLLRHWRDVYSARGWTAKIRNCFGQFRLDRLMTILDRRMTVFHARERSFHLTATPAAPAATSTASAAATCLVRLSILARPGRVRLRRRSVFTFFTFGAVIDVVFVRG
jgi:hypothetical protein